MTWTFYLEYFLGFLSFEFVSDFDIRISNFYDLLVVEFIFGPIRVINIKVCISMANKKIPAQPTFPKDHSLSKVV